MIRRIETSIAQQDASPHRPELIATIAWVHHALTSPELRAIVKEVDRDVEAGRTPRLATSYAGGELIAAAYFRILPGNVATLGGLRVMPGFEQECISLVASLTAQLIEAESDLLVQAIVDKTNVEQNSLLTSSGYALQTDVLQLWADTTVADQIDCELPSNLRWRPAADVSRQELLELIGSTFTSTLDCPILNRLRTVEDVLTGFEDGQQLSQLQYWFLLHRDTDDTGVGCLFLSPHSREVVEIVYLGLVPSVRGLHLGANLIGKAICTALDLGAHLLVAGVDSANWPALKAYYRRGFQVHQSKSVYFRAADVDGKAGV